MRNNVKAINMKSESTMLNHQRGAALLAMMAVIMILVTSAFLASLSLNKQRIEQNRNNAKALSEAKQALMAYAVVQSPPGKMLCPDIDGDGVADYSGVNCVTQRGFIPYRDLALKHYRDAFNNLLWYAVDARYVKTSGGELNPSLGGQLQVNGESGYVAVLIAPGTVLVNQQRSYSDDSSRVAQYLEGTNADGNSASYSRIRDENHNDEMLVLSDDDFWPVMEKRVLSEIAGLLGTYYRTPGCNELPWAATSASSNDSVLSESWGYVPMGLAMPYGGASGCPASLNAPSWMQAHWIDVLRYGVCGASVSRCITTIGDRVGSFDAIVISAGPPLSGQTRASSNISDYLESANADLNMQFEYRDLRNFDDGFNDGLYPILP